MATKTASIVIQSRKTPHSTEDGEAVIKYRVIEAHNTFEPRVGTEFTAAEMEKNMDKNDLSAPFAKLDVTIRMR